MKFFFSILVVGCVGLSVGAQKTAKATKPETERPQALLALLNDARIAAPEIGVDIFIKVAQSKKVTEPVWRREILEEAYRMAGDVKNPVRRQSIPFSRVPVDTQAGYLSYAYGLKLDGLSLKSRVIRALLKENKERAKQIVFELDGRLKLKPLECEESLAYDVGDIYEAVEETAKAVFSRKEIDEGVRALYLIPWFENLESPSQIGPAFDLLNQMQGSPTERQLLTAALAKAIARSFNDDRSFSFAAEREPLLNKLAPLVSGTEDLHKSDLKLSYREFLIKNLRAPRCTDSEIKKDSAVPPYVANANSLFADKPINLEDIVSSELKGGPKISGYWKSSDAVRLSSQFRALKSERKKTTDSGNESAEIEWAIKVNAFLENLEAWKANDSETESEVFNQKAVLFRVLLELIPDGKLYKSVFRSYLQFLNGSPIQKQNFIEWLYHVRWLLAESPGFFVEIAPEFPNPNFAVMLTAKKALGEPDTNKPPTATLPPAKPIKEAPKPTAKP